MYAQPPLRLLLKTVGLFLLIDLPFQFVVNGMNPPFALVLQSVLNDPADMLEQTEGTHGRRPVAARADAVQKLMGIDIAMVSGSMEVLYRFLIVLLHISAVKVQPAKLILRIVIASLCRNFKVLDSAENIFDGIFRETNLPSEVSFSNAFRNTYSHSYPLP